tara:strand:+ start:211 stop:855 length:645 start_codon:yes stop_codon:yes gene_type:complete
MKGGVIIGIVLAFVIIGGFFLLSGGFSTEVEENENDLEDVNRNQKEEYNKEELNERDDRVNPTRVCANNNDCQPDEICDIEGYCVEKEIDYDESLDEVVEGPQEPLIINGKTLDERLDEAYSNVHGVGSAQQIREDFPDIELVYTDLGVEDGFPENILPFEYFYSAEADKTFSLCAIDRTIFVCDGKIDRKVTDEQMNNPDKCAVTSVYSDYLN